jgi:hypothetical protein
MKRSPTLSVTSRQAAGQNLPTSLERIDENSAAPGLHLGPDALARLDALGDLARGGR